MVTEYKQLLKVLSTICFFCLLFTAPSFAKENGSWQKIRLEEAFNMISKKHKVYFTYDKSIIENVVVDYKETGKNVEENLDALLKGTPLKFKIFENLFVIVFSSNEAGIKSMKEMIKQFNAIIEDETNNLKDQKKIIKKLETLNNFSPEEPVKLDPIKGKVISGDGKPLAGASIIVQGTKNGTTTNENGDFELNVQGTQDVVLLVSNIGFETSTHKVSGGKSIIITLVSAKQELTDVVVVGYGTSRKKDLTGSVSRITSKDFNTGAITNPLQQITGKIAGVTITQIGSEPGTAPSVRIRGLTSLRGGNNPLVVMDGVQGGMDLLSLIPPNEIETFDVLKDASATAIYGARGAAGVIIVSTKKTGASNQIEYNSGYSIDKFANKLDMMDTSDWIRNATARNVDASAFKGGNTDWWDLLTQTGFSQSHTLAFGGGANGFSYRASFNAILQKGTVINSKANNYIGRLVATQKALDNKLTLTMILNNSYNNNKYSPGSAGRAAFRSNLISNTYIARPTDPVYNPDGTYFIDNIIFEYLNPYGLAQTVTSDVNKNYLMSSFRADLEIIKGLTAGWFGSWRKLDENVGNYTPPASTNATAIAERGIANINNFRYDEKLMDISLNYSKKINDHNFSIMGVYEWQKYIRGGNFTQVRTFISDLTTYNALQLGDITKTSIGDIGSHKVDRTMYSFLSRINYSFNSRYFLTASIRRDASSVFGANYKVGYFPSVAGAWDIMTENFMNNQKIFTALKLKGGYGVTGNSEGIGPQRSIRRVSNLGITYFAGSEITNYAITQNENPDLRWETKKMANLGLDFAVLNNRLLGSIEVYKGRTTNLLFDYAVPQPPYPYSSILGNVGTLENKGIELSIEGVAIKTDDLKLSIIGNLSFNNNKVITLNGTIGGNPVSTVNVGMGNEAFIIAGKPIGTYYTLLHEGVDSVTGKETFVDVDKDGMIEDGNTGDDRVYAGQALPKYAYGISPTLSYKRLEISMLWRGQGGNKIYNTLRRSFSLFENIGKSNLLKSAEKLNMFTTERSSTLWLEDAKFLRFDNFRVAYKLDVTNIKYVSAINLSFTANNLALFTKYSGLDPEIGISGDNGSGGDNGIYPRSRSFGLGVNVILK